MLEEFAGHTHGGMAKKSESINAREIMVMRDELMHNFGF
jgi:hypothetical protein